MLGPPEGRSTPDIDVGGLPKAPLRSRSDRRSPSEVGSHANP